MIVLNPYDPRPIYEQVRDGIKKQIVTGVFKPGDRLPSVRELATQLVINPNTIQRAYRELETEGYIYKLVGRGTFAANRQGGSELTEAKLLADFSRSVTYLLFSGYDEQKLVEKIAELKKEVDAGDERNRSGAGSA